MKIILIAHSARRIHLNLLRSQYLSVRVSCERAAEPHSIASLSVQRSAEHPHVPQSENTMQPEREKTAAKRCQTERQIRNKAKHVTNNTDASVFLKKRNGQKKIGEKTKMLRQMRRIIFTSWFRAAKKVRSERCY